MRVKLLRYIKTCYACTKTNGGTSKGNSLSIVQVFDWSLGKVFQFYPGVRLSDIDREGQGLLEEVNHHAAAVRHTT